MNTSEITIGDFVWYLFRSRSTGMTHQSHVEVLNIHDERVKVRGDYGRMFWVKAKNLRPVK